VTEGESNVFRGFVLVLVSVSFGFAQVKFFNCAPPSFLFSFLCANSHCDRRLFCNGFYFV